MRKIGIVGGGSVGLLLASYFCECNYDVTVYTNTKEQADELKRNKLTLQINNHTRTNTIKSVSFSEVKALTDDCLFLAVKQYDLKEVITNFFKIKGTVTSIVFLQNGMGHLHLLDELKCSVENIFVGIIEHGALKVNYTKVIHTGIGEMKIGAFQRVNDKCEALWQQLTTVGFKAKRYENWLELVEKKLIINAIINPLTALYKVKNGELVCNQFYFKVMRQLFEEISLVVDCHERDWEQVVDVCKKTSENSSSMLKDLLESRQTEIEAITGVILQRAKKQGIKLVLNDFLYESIKGMEQH